MRFDTINAANYLVWRLQHSGAFTNLRDDGDIIYLEHQQTRERIMIYMIERLISLQDVQHYFQTNTQKGIHTLIILWVDMLLPSDRSHYLMDDWMEALVALYDNKIYGFEVAGREAYFFPVYFDGAGRQRHIRFGNIVNYGQLHGYSVNSTWGTMRGDWHVAGFGVPQQAKPAIAPHLAEHFKVLGIAYTQDVNAIKQAYRALARRFHPDVNRSANAHQRMKRINDAYRHILRHFEDE